MSGFIEKFNLSVYTGLRDLSFSKLIKQFTNVKICLISPAGNL